MMLFRTVILLTLVLTIPDAVCARDFYLDSPGNNGLFRSEINNDAIWERDSNFSNGWSLQYHTVRYENWDQSKAPGLFKWVGNHFPTLNHGDSIVRYGHGIGQSMITPGDLSTPNPPEGDLPYAGTLTYTLNWQNFNRRSARTFQINIGVLGEEAYAGEVQTYVHNDLQGEDEPMGWGTQRDSEPIVNLAYSQIWRLARWGRFNNDWAGQIAISPSLHLGNLFTAGEVGAALRFGWNIEEGFSAYPAPPGRGIFQSPHIPKPPTASRHGFEFTLGVRATEVIYAVVYDGSIITGDDRSVERKHFVYAGGFGIHYHYYDHFSARLSLLFNSDLLEADAMPASRPGEDATSVDNSYGTLVIDFHF